MNQFRKILIIEDHDLVAYSLREIAREAFPEPEVVVSKTFPGSLEMIRTGFAPDLIILDMHLPGGESYGMVNALRSLQAGVRILIYTASDEPRHALNFLSAGANGFLRKSSPREHVAVAITTVMSGKKYMDEDVQQLVAESFFKKINPSKTFGDTVLSPREREVLDLLLDGKLTTQIASELNLKMTTVSTHKTRIFEKMNVTNIIELFRKLKPEA